MMPQSDSVFGPVLSCLNQGRYSAAMMKLTNLSHEYSKDLNYLRLLAKTQKALADFSALIITLKYTARLTNLSADYIEHMLTLYSQGRLNEALDIALNLEEKSLSVSEKKIVAHCLIKIYLEFFDYEGAEEVIRMCNTAAQDDLMMFALGLVFLARGEQNEALVYLRKSVELNCKNDQAWVSLSLLHEDMGDHEIALANLDKAFDANPNNATGLKLLTKWHRRDAGQVNKAIRHIRYYLSKFEFDEEISLCYMQLLKEVDDVKSLHFEAEKLVLYNPNKLKYSVIKKNLELRMKLQHEITMNV